MNWARTVYKSSRARVCDIMDGSTMAQRSLPLSTSYIPNGDPGPYGGGTYTSHPTEPSLRDYENVFGPSARDIKDDMQKYKRHGRWHLPDILKGPNPWLTDRIDGLITDATNSPFTSVILPYRYFDNVDGKIKWNVWSFDEGMASRVPYEAAARTLTQTKRSYAGYAPRHGLAINLEHNFMMTPQGRENFQNQLKQLIGSIQYSNDLDVHMALILAPSYEKIQSEKYYGDTKTPPQVCREFVDLFGFMQKNQNALDILIEESKSRLKTWGGPMPDFLLCNSKLGFQLQMVPERTNYLTQGPDGVKRLKQGPDISSYRGLKIINTRAFSMETGVPPRDMLRRRVRVAEYYRIPPSPLNFHREFELYNEARDNWFALTFMDLLNMARLEPRLLHRMHDVSGGSDEDDPESNNRELIKILEALDRGDVFEFGKSVTVKEYKNIQNKTLASSRQRPSFFLGVGEDSNVKEKISTVLDWAKRFKEVKQRAALPEAFVKSLIISTTGILTANNSFMFAVSSSECGNIILTPQNDFLSSVLREDNSFQTSQIRFYEPQIMWLQIVDQVRKATTDLASPENTRRNFAFVRRNFFRSAISCKKILALIMEGSPTITIDESKGSEFILQPFGAFMEPNNPYHFQTFDAMYRDHFVINMHKLIFFTSEVIDKLYGPLMYILQIRDKQKRIRKTKKLASHLFKTALNALKGDLAADVSLEFSKTLTIPSDLSNKRFQGKDYLSDYVGFVTMPHLKDYEFATSGCISSPNCIFPVFNTWYNGLVPNGDGSLSQQFLQRLSETPNKKDLISMFSTRVGLFETRTIEWDSNVLPETSKEYKEHSRLFFKILKARLLHDAFSYNEFNVPPTYYWNKFHGSFFTSYGNKDTSPVFGDESSDGYTLELSAQAPEISPSIIPRVHGHSDAQKIRDVYHHSTLFDGDDDSSESENSSDDDPSKTKPSHDDEKKSDDSNPSYKPSSLNPFDDPSGPENNLSFQAHLTQNIEIVIVRPNIEHYMLGIIMGLAGESLGNTLWGQTELSVYDDSMHGVWGMSYK
jgi:hypothetical protein